MGLTLSGDVRDAWRTVRRDLRFHLPLVLLLALPVATLVLAGTAVHGLLLEPPSFPRPHELVLVSNRFGHDGRERSPASAPELLDYRSRLPSLRQLSAVNSFSAALGSDGGPAEQLQVGVTSGEFFSTLGADPLHGRLYSRDDDTPLDTRDSANSSVIVLSHELWRRRYGEDPDAVGRLVRVGGTPMRVIGVLPPGFRLRLPPGGMTTALDAWTPLRIDYAGAPREGRYLTLVGRLAPGRTVTRLAAEADGAARDLRGELAEYDRARLTLAVEPLHQASVAHLRPTLLLVAAAAGLVLALATINVGGMLLVRLIERGRELAVRTALGASAGRLLRQLAGEIAIVSAGATVLGFGFAVLGLRVVRGAGFHPELDALALPSAPDALLAGLLVALAMAAGLGLLGALPGLSMTRALREGPPDRRGTAGLHRRWPRLRGALIAAEVALSLLLVIGAGLLLRSSLALRSLPLGFEPRQVLTFRVALPFSRYPDPGRWAERYDELRGELAALPGVQAVGAADALPASGGSATAPFALVPSGGADWGARSAVYRTVSPGYFEALGMSLRAGRGFAGADRAGAPPVIVVDESFARRVWARSPLGERLEVQVEDFSEGYRLARIEATVVGVVSTVPHDRPDGPHPGTIYLPLGQQPAWSVALAIRTRGDPASFLEPARRTVARIDPELPAYDARPLTDLVGATFALTDLALTLLLGFALLALAVSAAGLFGLVAYLVHATRRDQAIRMACGATPGRLVARLLWSGLAPAIAGVAGGAVLALQVVGGIEGLLVGIRPADPLTLGAAMSLVLLVAALSTFAAAVAVVRLEPARLLRGS